MVHNPRFKVFDQNSHQKPENFFFFYLSAPDSDEDQLSQLDNEGDLHPEAQEVTLLTQLSFQDSAVIDDL